MRELLWMVEGRNEAEWSRTACVLAMINNQNPYRKRAVKPAEFMPGADDREKYTMSLSEAARIFGGQ